MSFDPSIISMSISYGDDINVELDSNVSIVPGGGSEWRKILTRAFTSLTDDMFPVGIIELAEYLFQYNEDLTYVDLTKIISVGNRTFYGCNISDLNMPRLKTIGSLAFCQNAFETLVLPEVTTIGELAFAECENLTSVDFSNISRISNRAFYNCTNLNTVIFRNDELVTCPGSDSFRNTKIDSGAGYFYVKESLLNEYLADESWSLVYPNAIRSIEEYNK